LSSPFLLYSQNVWLNELWYKLLRKTLEHGGAAFIKWGQWASTRYDVFPSKLCKELEELQAGAPEHTWEQTKAILERSYGAEQLGAIFAWMDPTPIASGSIAQIHRAKLQEGKGIYPITAFRLCDCPYSYQKGALPLPINTTVWLD
jgi:aarF domain-containing kinase